MIDTSEVPVSFAAKSFVGSPAALPSSTACRRDLPFCGEALLSTVSAYLCSELYEIQVASTILSSSSRLIFSLSRRVELVFVCLSSLLHPLCVKVPTVVLEGPRTY